MDFEPSDSQKLMVEVIRGIFEKEFDKAYCRRLEEEARWPTEVLERLGQHGFTGIVVPEEYGGSGGTTVDATLCLEEVARNMGGPATAYFLTMCFGARTISEVGSDAQRAAILPGLLAGTSFIGLSLTEPDGGTDILGAMRSHAERSPDGSFVINGAKIFTTGAQVADWVIAVVRTDGFEQRRSHGITMFLVPTSTPGVEIEPIPLFCSRSTGANHVRFTDVRVPESAILGELHKGLTPLFGILNDERIGSATMCLGIAQAALDEALAYVMERKAFGRPIGQFQAVQHKIAECWTRLEAARRLVYYAACLQANKRPAEKESSAAKLFASEAVIWIVNECMDMLGGYQCTLDFSMSYYLRDARYTFAPITNNAAKNLIGERLGLPKSY